MSETKNAAETEAPFDGIVDNKIPGMPISAWVLFLGLIAWGVAFSIYFLATGYSHEAEFEAKMAAQQVASKPAPKPHDEEHEEHHEEAGAEQ